MGPDQWEDCMTNQQSSKIKLTKYSATIQDKISLFACFLRLHKIEMGTSKQKINVIVPMLQEISNYGKRFAVSWDNKDEAESV